ncbi:membrane protein insertase YidC [Chitinophaga horti]|uniref:Membrane protein insertase YidC n=1 Tax=Chitinophaga horti TaxID=2920382 RepID=A0ABY6IWA8_9BACT|nr:membrane protein insertase YidC [Chitinophaga horti]UYQ91658.1 membrane protein insertase YidC [Chitinophaga horti]
MDRNSIIGFLLIGALLVGYIFYNNKTQVAAQKEKHRKDSIAALNKPKEDKTPVVDSTGHVVTADSATLAANYGVLANAVAGTEQVQVLENDVVRIELTNKGGQPKLVRVKAFKGEGAKNNKQFLSSDGKPLDLQAGSYNRISLALPVNGKQVNTADLYFAGSQIQTNADGSQVVTYRLETGNPAQYLEYIYTLAKDSYVVNFNIHAVGMHNLIAGNTLPLQWNSRFTKQEHDMTSERMNNQMHYRLEEKGHDYFTLQNKSQEKLEKVQWLSFKQQFFNVTFMPKKGTFASADITTNVPQSPNIVGEQMTTLQLPYDRSANYSFPIDIYYGPNHYKTLKSFGNDFESIIPLGTGIFAFVKYVNKWIIIPVFNLLSGSISNYGLIIILLTIFIRLLIAPFTYQSYVSQAKMKVLKPELDALRAKHGDDQQAFGMEQMKLFRSAGVSPLGGCLPALLQLPILVAMYSFFPSSIELRQESFLWATDLSTYDSILNFGFEIPFYGNHVSLFTLLMTVTSLILAFYNRGMTDQSNPVMKYMPYVFPIMLLGIFNKLAAALTFYYFLSNVISIVLQFVLQNFVINHAKIHAQIEENKKKPKTQSKFAEKMAELQKRQQEMQKQQQSRKK